MVFGLLVYFVLCEGDRLEPCSAKEGAKRLEVGYSGVWGAESSSEADKRSILSDIGECAQLVDQHLSVLTCSGMSTPSLRAAADLGVDLDAAATFRSSVVWIGFVTWAYSAAVVGGAPGVHIGFELFHPYSQCRPLAACWLALLGASLFLYARAERDERAFIGTAIAKVQTIVFVCTPVALLDWSLRDAHGAAWYANWARAFHVLCSLCAVSGALCAALGRRRTAQLPAVGKSLSRLLGPGAGGGCRGRWQVHRVQVHPAEAPPVEAVGP